MAHNETEPTTDAEPDSDRVIPTGDDGKADYDAALTNAGVQYGTIIRFGNKTFVYRGWVRGTRSRAILEPHNTAAQNAALIADGLTVPSLCFAIQEGRYALPECADDDVVSVEVVTHGTAVPVESLTLADAADKLRDYAKYLNGNEEREVKALRRDLIAAVTE